MSIDFRACLYALSDVIINRPAPLRIFDQIYMKIPDMLLQAEAASRWFDGKDILFIGDGDGIGLTMAHLGAKDLLPCRPASIKVLDFDERVVNSVNQFAYRNDLTEIISAELYNVAYPLPERYWQRYDGFYTNPPWGASNEGNSVRAFIRRGIESLGDEGLACVIIGDHPSHAWTHQVQMATQRYFMDAGFRVIEMLPEFHRYHLDDSPELASCALFFKRGGAFQSEYSSAPLPGDEVKNFYGQDSPLSVKYVRDLTNGGKLASRDIELEPWSPEE